MFPKMAKKSIVKMGQVVYNTPASGEMWGKVGKVVRMFYFQNFQNKDT
jgi:hypothetical protein